MAAIMTAVVGWCDIVMFVLTAEVDPLCNRDELKEESLPDPTW